LAVKQSRAKLLYEKGGSETEGKGVRGSDGQLLLRGEELVKIVREDEEDEARSEFNQKEVIYGMREKKTGLFAECPIWKECSSNPSIQPN